MASIFVTVGMGPWPFDRLIAAIAPLCAHHEVVAQTGTSRVRPPCPHAPFMSYHEALERLRAADVVVTHAGNTVRLVQRAGRVPIAVARRAALGEMGNDHQVDYLRLEEQTGRVIAVWELERLPAVVAGHPAAERRLLAERPLPPVADPDRVTATLDTICARLIR